MNGGVGRYTGEFGSDATVKLAVIDSAASAPIARLSCGCCCTDPILVCA